MSVQQERAQLTEVHVQVSMLAFEVFAALKAGATPREAAILNQLHLAKES
jgi:hypothetical protein